MPTKKPTTLPRRALGMMRLNSGQVGISLIAPLEGVRSSPLPWFGADRAERHADQAHPAGSPKASEIAMRNKPLTRFRSFMWVTWFVAKHVETGRDP